MQLGLAALLFPNQQKIGMHLSLAQPGEVVYGKSSETPQTAGSARHLLAIPDLGKEHQGPGALPLLEESQ